MNMIVKNNSGQHSLAAQATSQAQMATKVAAYHANIMMQEQKANRSKQEPKQ